MPAWVVGPGSVLFFVVGNAVERTLAMDRAIEERRAVINHLMEEVAQLAEQDVSAADFSREVLRSAAAAFGHVAAAVWSTTPTGHLQLLAESHLNRLRNGDQARRDYNDLRRFVGARLQPTVVPPRGLAGPNGVARNPTPYTAFLVPILVDKQLAGLIEVWREAAAHPAEPRYCLHYLVTMANLAATHHRAQRLRQISGQQQLWIELEAFTRLIHRSLDPTVVGYRIANEGRRLIGCDRVSVAVCDGGAARIEAISGVAVIEKRSALVRALVALSEAVRSWGEPLVFQGTRDETLPPAILQTLDAYLAESQSTQLVVLPLRVEEEREVAARPVRGLLIAESFESAQTPGLLKSRAESLGRHAAAALSNAVEHRRIPLRWAWQPLIWLEDGIGGKARAIAAVAMVAIVALFLMFTSVSYPLKIDARGQILPQNRAWVYPPVEGHIVRFEVVPGMEVHEGQPLVLMHDSNLELKLVNLVKEISAAQKEIQGCNTRYDSARTNEAERVDIAIERRKHEAIRDLKMQERDRLRALTSSDDSTLGNFWVRAPIAGTILNFDFRENLTGKFVRPSEPLLRVGDTKGVWEAELKVPHRHIGQVLQAFELSRGKELDVGLLPLSAPTETFRGKLARDQIAGEAAPDVEDRNEMESVVSVRVRIDGADIATNERLPKHLLLTGSEVRSRVNCGDHALGYSLFYGVWEFVYERVVFFF